MILGRHVLHDNESHTDVGRQSRQHFLQSGEPTCRSADSHDDQAIFFLFSLLSVASAWGNDLELVASIGTYQDALGNVIEGMSLTGPIAAGVPGSVDGLLHALQSYGTMTREDVMAPAIGLAEDGFPLHPRAANLFR